MTQDTDLETRKEKASSWFLALQNQIIAALEALEAKADKDLFPGVSGVFEKTPWQRSEEQELGGGVMGLLNGRLFEKAGVHFSKVYGQFEADFAKQIKGAADNDGAFWASGISVIVHPRSPVIPAVHMNTRMISTSKSWFGGGADLTPLLDSQRHSNAPFTLSFHEAMKSCCAAYNPEYYPTYKQACDEYFYLAHRDEPRGVGGLFIDHLDTGNWDEDFSFIKDVGRYFLQAYEAIVLQAMAERWSPQQREEQLVRRGRYVEFNLLYDRGTTFGLKTKGNVKSILSSMPPVVKWP